MAIPRSGNDAVNKYQFLNREKQPETGYMDLVNRFYDPTIGRFMQADPVTETQENYSTYQYGWNNPILRSDPNGDCPFCPAIPWVAAGLVEGLVLLTDTVIVAGGMAAIENLAQKAGPGAGLYSPSVGAASRVS